MKYPNISNTNQQREVAGFFAGLNQTIRCQEGEFSDAKNITTKYFPAISPREKRGICPSFVNLQGILDKESLIYIDDGKLYIDGQEKTLKDGMSFSDGKKDLYKMAAFLVIMPDRIWYNCDKDECGYIDASVSIASGSEVKFSLVNGDGNAISWHDSSYYESHEPADGDYMMTTTDAKTSLKVYSKVTSIWSTVTTTYLKMEATGIGKAFEKSDGVKIIVDNTDAKWDYAEKLFVNKEDDGRLSINTWIKDKGDDYITFIGLLKENKTFTNLPCDVERKMPDVAYITECQNRLWACSKDGHEIYCCKLGDVTNWNYFEGISIDSYAATVGSDGKFTGCATYNQNPIFFKEDCFLKVNVSPNGAHSYREQQERGMQDGSYKSICLVNGVLYYKGTSCVYAYDGSSPQKVSDALGEHRYTDAVGGTIDGRYYLSMKDERGKRVLFTYDTTNRIWGKEDDTDVDFFCRHKTELYIVSGNNLYSVNGTYEYGDPEKEKDVPWFIESGNIGFEMPDQKYVSRITVRATLEAHAYVDFFIEYDSDGVWRHCFNISGKGTQTYLIPVIPIRCDHYRYRISGRGGCKIHSITKTIEEGADV